MFNPEKIISENKRIITGLGYNPEEDLERLPAKEVKNEVLWVNKDVEMPFNLEVGKAARLGMFLSSNISESEKSFPLGAMEWHMRSGLVGKVVFKDQEGRLYRDVDIKGVGAIKMEFPSEKLVVEKMEPQEKHYSKETPHGFCDYKYAENDKHKSELLLKKGLRTHRVLGIIKLKEVIDEDGNKISIAEARKNHYIRKNTQPVLEVRAFGTKARIMDFNSERTNRLLLDARIMIAQELGKKPEEFSREDYLEWFAKTLGEQVAIIHNAGYWDGYLTEHNITLDCRVVDLDSVERFTGNGVEKTKEITKDISLVLRSLGSLLMRIGGAVFYAYNFKKFKNLFIDGYLSNIKDRNIRINVQEMLVEL